MAFPLIPKGSKFLVFIKEKRVYREPIASSFNSALPKFGNGYSEMKDFRDETALREWIGKNRDVEQFHVFRISEVNVSVNIDISVDNDETV